MRPYPMGQQGRGGVALLMTAVASFFGGGLCGACRLRWLEGEPIHGDLVLRPDERKTELMACTAQSASDELMVDL
ncbi:hypothetical protein [Salipiger thiooxidans]|uniref:hypothetical protein n=1 Tax=Salipiger thiooxidans TaxID=282683 RepID=UPI0010424000|nr:hypothetical protein [Salipiger thiooxidans]